MSNARKPVLFVGGSGLVGAETARVLRSLHPEQPVLVGGRNVERARATARRLELADDAAVTIDLTRGDLGLPPGTELAAIAMFVKEPHTRALALAQEQGAAYLDISTGAFELAPELARIAAAGNRAAVFLGSSWLAGAATLVALHFVRQLASVRAIRLAAVLDEQDMGGPAAHVDFERLMAGSPARPLALRDGGWALLAPDEATRTLRAVDGVELAVQAYSIFDVPALATHTGARDVRFDFVLGETASRRRGEAFSTEVAIEIDGATAAGVAVSKRHDFVHPRGQAPVTAWCVALAIEALLGLHGRAAAAPGIHLPDTLLDPEAVVSRLRASGAVIS
jgi:hypothetical protein